MDEPANLPSLREVADRFGLDARRSLGQHFLFDENLLDRIAAAAGILDGKAVIEVGAGPGGLTRALLRRGAERVVAIEKDRRCVAALQGLAARCRDRLQIVEADALGIDIATLTARPAIVVGNLPFNAATEILMRLLGQAERVEAMVLMFQKEVADRIAAAPGGRDYGRLSVLVQWRCHVESRFELPGRVFVPPARVRAGLLRIRPLAGARHEASEDSLRRVLGAAFSQRRKTLRNALKSLDLDPDDLLREAGIDPGRRAESLTIAQYCHLARACEAMGRHGAPARLAVGNRPRRRGGRGRRSR